MVLSNYIKTFGQHLLQKYGERVHKISINANLSCPNRDGTKGIGGCTFCNNASFNPDARNPDSISQQISAGKKTILKRTGAKKYLAYFQAYSNTYADIKQLKKLYDLALAEENIMGLSIGTRPDCLPLEALDLLASYQDKGYEIWLELGLQSAFDATLKKVNRGHGYAEYYQAIQQAHARQLQVCTHLIIGLPGENSHHFKNSFLRVLDDGVQGIKFHPLHIVKGTQMARQWRNNHYTALTLDDYVNNVVDLIELAPDDLIYHRITATASKDILLAPAWCEKKWRVINKITQALHKRYKEKLITPIVNQI